MKCYVLLKDANGYKQSAIMGCCKILSLFGKAYVKAKKPSLLWIIMHKRFDYIYVVNNDCIYYDLETAKEACKRYDN